MKRLKLYCILSVILLIGFLTAPTRTYLAGSPSALSSLRLGVNLHPLHDWYAPSQVVQQLGLAQNTGSSIIRIDIHWAWIEPFGAGPANWNQSQIDRLDAFIGNLPAGMDVLGMVTETPCWASTDPNKNCDPANFQVDWRYPPADLQDYTDFLAEIVTRYKSKIKYWEIWNEPNYPGFWANPNPVTYTLLLQTAYPVIKATDPNAVVVAGALAPWDGSTEYNVNALAYLEGMYAAGAKGYFDRLSYHPYTDGQTPAWYDPLWPMHSFSHSIPAIRQLMLAQGDSSPLWLTEVGWTTVPTSCTDCWTPTLPKTEAEQAAYLAQAVDIVKGWDYVEAFFWYELVDTITPPPGTISFDSYFGLYRRDYTPKPAARQFKNMALPYNVFLPLGSR